MPIFLTDTVAPDNSTFKIADGKDIGGALTGSDISGSGTGSFGKIKADIADTTDGSFKTVVWDNSTKLLFVTTSTAGGTPSLEAVSQVDPFKIYSNTVLTASNNEGYGSGQGGIYVQKIFNGSGGGRINFATSSDSKHSVFRIADYGTGDSVNIGFGLEISGGLDDENRAPTINAADQHIYGLVIAHSGSEIISSSKKLTGLNGPDYNLVINKGTIGNSSGFGNIRYNLGRTEGLDIRQLIVRDIGSTTDSTTLYDTTIKTRIGQTGGTGAHQHLVFSGSGIIVPPTASLPPAVEGALVYSGSEFYIAVP